MRRRGREVFAEWFRVKGTSKVRREKEHCRDDSGTGGVRGMVQSKGDERGTT